MHDPLPVRHCQRLRDGDTDFQNFIRRHRPLAQPVGQRFAFEELHDEEVGAVLRSNIVKMADVGMIQRRNRLCFALHALFQFRRRRKMRKEDFNRDRAVQPGIRRPVYLTHTARAQRRLDFVRTEFGARGQ